MRGISNKKGQVSNMAPAILGLVFAAIVLVFGLIISQSVRDTNTIRDAYSGTVLNETLTTVDNITGEQVAAWDNRGFNDFTVLYASNATSGAIIPATNYTTSEGGYIISTQWSTYLDQNWNVSYTYNYGGEAFESSNNTLIGLGTFGDFWEIIVLAIVISIVIGLLLVIFGGSRRR